jgi:ankyrin repeat protein
VSPFPLRRLAAALLVAGAGAAHAGDLSSTLKAGNAAAARALLAERADPNDADADGTTALHWAVHHAAAELAQALLDAGAKSDARNRYGVPPLYLAAENGDAAMVELLIARGADPNTALPEGETALMTAARTGDTTTLGVLLEHGARVNDREGWKGQTALMWAAHENNAPAIRTLLQAGAERDARSAAGEFSALLFAVRAGSLDAAQALLDAGADANETLQDGTSALVLAATNAHYEVAALLLERGAEPNAAAQGWTALHQIAWSRRWNMGFNLPGPAQTGDLDGLELVRRLVAKGADVDARQTTEPADGNRSEAIRWFKKKSTAGNMSLKLGEGQQEGRKTGQDGLTVPLVEFKDQGLTTTHDHFTFAPHGIRRPPDQPPLRPSPGCTDHSLRADPQRRP